MPNPNLEMPPAEGPANHEAAIIREKKINAVLGATINDPIKLLAYGAMASNPGEEFSSTELAKRVHEMQGDKAEGKISNSKMLRLCEDFLLPSKLVHARNGRTTRGGTVFVANPGPVTALATVGTILEWQSENMDKPPQRLFGKSNRRVKDGLSSSMVRYDMLHGLVTLGPASQQEIADRLNEPVGRVREAVTELETQKVVSIGRKFNRDQRTFIIDMEADFESRRYPGDNIGALAAAAKRLGVVGVREVTANLLLDVALQIDGSLDREVLWETLKRSSARGRLPFIKNPKSTNSNKNDLTEIWVRPVYGDAIADLGERIKRLKEGPEEAGPTENGVHQARLILGNKDMVAELVRLATENTHRVASPSEEQFLTAVKRHLPQSGTDIRQLYQGIIDDGYNLTYDSFRGRLTRLEDVRVVDGGGVSSINSPLGYVTLRKYGKTSAPRPPSKKPSPTLENTVANLDNPDGMPIRTQLEGIIAMVRNGQEDSPGVAALLQMARTAVEEATEIYAAVGADPKSKLGQSQDMLHEANRQVEKMIARITEAANTLEEYKNNNM